MKYDATVKDIFGLPINPVFETGTAAQHFVSCIQMFLHVFNGGKDLEEGIQKKIDKTFMMTHTKEAAGVVFISMLHKHPEITPENFLYAWGNSSIPELEQFLALPVDSEESYELIIKFLEKIKIPGVGYTNVYDCSKDMLPSTPESLTSICVRYILKNQNRFRAKLHTIPKSIKNIYPMLELNPNARLRIRITQILEQFEGKSTEFNLVIALTDALAKKSPYREIHNLMTDKTFKLKSLKVFRAQLIKALNNYHARRDTLNGSENKDKLRKEITKIIETYKPRSFDTTLLLGLKAVLSDEDTISGVRTLLEKLKSQHTMAYNESEDPISLLKRSLNDAEETIQTERAYNKFKMKLNTIISHFETSSTEGAFILAAIKALQKSRPYNALHAVITNKEFKVAILRPYRQAIVDLLKHYHKNITQLTIENNIQQLQANMDNILQTYESKTFEGGLLIHLWIAIKSEAPLEIIEKALEKLSPPNDDMGNTHAMLMVTIKECCEKLREQLPEHELPYRSEFHQSFSI